MDTVNIIESYKSRRNCVKRVEFLSADKRSSFVVKEYNGAERLQRCIAEHKRLEYLRSNGICVPKPCGIMGDALLMEYIPGMLVNDLVDRMEGGGWIEALALWFAKYHSMKIIGKSLVKGDVNLRNFIYSEGKIYGLDFEEDNYGDPITDIADICFFILTNYPPLTQEKDFIAREFLREYSKLSGLCLENIARQILKSRSNAVQRRRNTCQRDK